MIEVYGECGAGKTTLVKYTTNYASERGIFKKNHIIYLDLVGEKSFCFFINKLYRNNW